MVCLPAFLFPPDSWQNPLGSRKLGFQFWLCQNISCPWEDYSFPSASFSFGIRLLAFNCPLPSPPINLSLLLVFLQGVILSCRSPGGIVSFLAGRERSKIIFLITQLRLGSNLHFKVLLIRIWKCAKRLWSLNVKWVGKHLQRHWPQSRVFLRVPNVF